MHTIIWRIIRRFDELTNASVVIQNYPSALKMSNEQDNNITHEICLVATKYFIYILFFHINQICRRKTAKWMYVDSLRPRHFAEDVFKRIFLNENVWISLRISLKFVPKCPINKSPALVQIMAWRRPGDKPLSEPMMVNLMTHICVTRPQWVKPFIFR